jgi:hypothetical protein
MLLLSAAMLTMAVLIAAPAMAQDDPRECPPLGLLALIDPKTGEFLGCVSPAEPCPPGFKVVFLSSFEVACKRANPNPSPGPPSPKPTLTPPVVRQEFEQEGESGDVDQAFTVTSEGNSSNQCAGVDGTANTGNSQNMFGFTQYASDIGDFSLEDSGSSLDVGGTPTTQCTQEVNQAAAAG